MVNNLPLVSSAAMALLTPSELAWLKGEKQVSKAYARYLRHSIRKKLQVFLNEEFPLVRPFLSSGGVVRLSIGALGGGVSANTNAVRTSANAGKNGESLTNRTDILNGNGKDEKVLRPGFVPAGANPTPFEPGISALRGRNA